VTVAGVTTDDELRDFRESVASFVANEVAPRAEELDQHGVFPHELFQRLGANGYFGVRYPEELGGQGADFTAAAVLFEELAYGSLSLAAIFAMQALMGTHFLYESGNEEQREAYLRPALAGEKIAGFALTEPEAGSDLGAMKTSATRVDGGWEINGGKTWITSAPVADFITVGARSEPGEGMRGISLFLVDAGNPGFSVGKPIEKLGVRSSLTSEVHFDGCVVEESALLGGAGTAADQLGSLLAQIRAMTSALALGLARRALDDSLQYAADRQAFGRPISHFQAIQQKLADMATGIYASRLMTYDVARRIDLGEDVRDSAAMAKLFATETCATVVDETTRIFGSYGFASEYPAQRHFRDARFLLYGGGTSELLRGLIAKRLKPGRGPA
jgi:alkylation response protein AidB-like acyl-CoA dehydrogenase